MINMKKLDAKYLLINGDNLFSSPSAAKMIKIHKRGSIYRRSKWPETIIL